MQLQVWAITLPLLQAWSNLVGPIYCSPAPERGKSGAILGHTVSWLGVTSALGPRTLPPAEEGQKSPTLLSTHLRFSLQGLKTTGYLTPSDNPSPLQTIKLFTVP